MAEGARNPIFRRSRPRPLAACCCPGAVDGTCEPCLSPFPLDSYVGGCVFQVISLVAQVSRRGEGMGIVNFHEWASWKSMSRRQPLGGPRGQIGRAHV